MRLTSERGRDAAWCAGVAALSLAYTAIYFAAGFNTADDGNYAQIAYELFLGRAPADLAFNYGLAWFQAGTVLFRMFGVDYDLVRAVFFGSIICTNVLLFATIARLTGHRGFAAAATVAPALAPAFPATAFYGLCILLNAAAQIRLVRGPATPRNAALAGAALAVTFLIRPDFGYLFALPLFAVAVLTVPRGRMGDNLVGAALGFVAVMLPYAAIAAAGGYLELVAGQTLAYPAMMANMLIAGLSGTAQSAASAGTFLARPSLSDMFAADGDAATFAALVYLPVIGLLGYVVLAVARIVRSHRDVRGSVIAEAAVVLTAGAAAFPHYFAYRPDMPHVANFMAGYAVLAAALVWPLLRAVRESAGLRRAGTGLAAAGVAAHLGLYAWAGVRSPEAGGIAIARDRTERFDAGNGVAARVRTDEKQVLEFLRATIAANSKPGDAIVCLPYCPGVAFMTERRMLLRHFFVDDSFPTREPDWLAHAIELTRRERPPVVIVMDWAINGTEISRFKNWAPEYMALLEEIAREKVAYPGLTVYLL
ncbi:MAG: hypothetical protein SFV21_12430 [Rhodospirillaceae bacterium]|nr:hypothetical protein [Rhodospirillaceae bacterium]